MKSLISDFYCHFLLILLGPAELHTLILSPAILSPLSFLASQKRIILGKTLSHRFSEWAIRLQIQTDPLLAIDFYPVM